MSIYIATHKATSFPFTDWLVPIALGGYQGGPGMLTDTNGDNIADRNPEYSELTATYWLWKHCQDPYIGLCHYRRLFSFLPVEALPRKRRWYRPRPVPEVRTAAFIKTEPTPELLSFLAAPEQRRRLEDMLERYELVVAQPIPQYPSMAEHYRRAHDNLGWPEFVAACRDEFGDLAGVLELETRFYPCNMLVARAEVFRDYSATLFRVLEKVFERVGVPDGVPGARYQPYRYPAYLAERFTSLYLLASRARFATAQVVELI